MAIEIKYALNMALQYNNANEFDIEDYLLVDNETGKLFLTESPTKRVLNEAEKSALYFLIDDNLFNASAYYEMYNVAGVKIDHTLLELGYNHLIHNSIPVNLNLFYIDPDAKRMDVSIISNQDLISNGNFSLGSGNSFTDWSASFGGTGTLVQTTTGGLGGGRAPIITRTSGLALFLQPNVFVPANTYRISFWLKLTAGSGSMRLDSNTSSFATIIPTNEYVRYEYDVTTVGGDNQLIFVLDTNGMSVAIDNVSVYLTPVNYLTEIKSYIIDRECYNYTFQVNWLNKLGGRDTFMFGASPIISTNVDRNNLIELSKLRNFESPKRIYGYREHISFKTYSLAHQCKDRETAEWLKRELIDSIDVMLVINDYYYPVMVTNSSIVEDKVSHDYKVNLNFRLAFDNNIQTR